MRDKLQTGMAAVEASDRVFTLANVITFARLCLIPIFFFVLLSGRDTLAAFIFATAAATDFLDGQIARRTGTVTKLGQLLDPTVDRLLMITGVVGLLVVGRLPFWIILFVVGRDAYMLYGGWKLLHRYHSRVPVIFAGKIATTLLFVGFAGLLLNAPLFPGLGVVSFAWLPGFNDAACSWGIWFVYVGLVLSAWTTRYYVREGHRIEDEFLLAASGNGGVK